jgi:predicted nucleotidyltransferase
MAVRDYPTLAERKAERVVFLHKAVATLRSRLEEYARDHGGAFLLYGSAALGQMHYDSDVDILLDFDEKKLAEAWRFAERACWDLGLKPDLCPVDWCRQDFLAQVREHAVMLA